MGKWQGCRNTCCRPGQTVVGSWGDTEEAEARPGVRWPLVLLGLHEAKGSPVATTLTCHCNSRGTEGVWRSSVSGAVNSSGLSRLPKGGRRPGGVMEPLLVGVC